MTDHAHDMMSLLTSFSDELRDIERRLTVLDAKQKLEEMRERSQRYVTLRARSAKRQSPAKSFGATRRVMRSIPTRILRGLHTYPGG
jgi:hypothetical protein